MMARYLLKTVSLLVITQLKSLELFISLMTFGVIIMDPCTVDQREGTLITYTNGVTGNIFKVQSHSYCFEKKTLLGKDLKPAYQEFAENLKFFEKIIVDYLPVSKYGASIVLILNWGPRLIQDLEKSEHWRRGTEQS